MTHPTLLADDVLTAELGHLAGREREATAAFVVHLAEFDARRLYEGAGYRSMFSYCRAVLRLSEDAAYNRIKAARAARLFPAIVPMLIDGQLSPTTVRLLAPHLTAENHEPLLAAAAGKGKQDVEELLATWFPQPDVSPSVRKLPSRVVVTEEIALPEMRGAPANPVVVASAAPCAPFSSSGMPSKPALVRPLAPERYEVRFTASAETRALLREAQDLLGHWLCWSRTSSGGSSRPRRSRERVVSPARGRMPCLRACVARSPPATRVAARSSPRTDTDAARAVSWSSITSCHAPSAVPPPSRTSSFAVGLTTGTRSICSSGRASAGRRTRRARAPPPHVRLQRPASARRPRVPVPERVRGGS